MAIVIGIVLLGGLAAIVFSQSKRSSNNIAMGNKSVYCSANGTLSHAKSVQSHRSYCMQPLGDLSGLKPGVASAYSFRIIDDEGNVLKDFAVTHEKTMHFIVARKDLQDFQHLHPDYDAAAGVFALPDFVLPHDGQYRLFADFMPGKSVNPMNLPVTISSDLEVGDLGKYAPQPLRRGEMTAIVDGYAVNLLAGPAKPLTSGEESTLTFEISRDGKLVTDLEEYLGALGHSVILKEGDLQFIHAHPSGNAANVQNGKVSFAVNFPEAGTYKAFTQFQIKGKVITAEFVLEVEQGDSMDSENAGGSTPGMDHSMH